MLKYWAVAPCPTTARTGGEDWGLEPAALLPVTTKKKSSPTGPSPVTVNEFPDVVPTGVNGPPAVEPWRTVAVSVNGPGLKVTTTSVELSVRTWTFVGAAGTAVAEGVTETASEFGLSPEALTSEMT